MIEDEGSDIDEPDQSVQDRWYRYKRHRQAHGLDPVTYDEWLRAGQPSPVE